MILTNSVKYQRRDKYQWNKVVRKFLRQNSLALQVLYYNAKNNNILHIKNIELIRC